MLPTRLTQSAETPLPPGMGSVRIGYMDYTNSVQAHLCIFLRSILQQAMKIISKHALKYTCCSIWEGNHGLVVRMRGNLWTASLRHESDGGYLALIRSWATKQFPCQPGGKLQKTLPREQWSYNEVKKRHLKIFWATLRMHNNVYYSSDCMDGLSSDDTCR